MANEPQPQPQPQPQQHQQQPQQGGILSTISRIMFYYLIYSSLSNMFFGPKQGVAGPGGTVSNVIAPMYPKGEKLMMRFYISKNETYCLECLDDIEKTEDLIWKQEWVYGSKDDPLDKRVILKPDEDILNNHSLWAHVYFSVQGASPNPMSNDFHPKKTFYQSQRLNIYRKFKPQKAKVNLLSGEKEQVVHEIIDGHEANTTDKYISFWKPSMLLQIVDDATTYNAGFEIDSKTLSLPPQIVQKMNFDESGKYYPTIYFNNFWHLKETEFQINSTVSELPFNITLGSIGLFYWQLQVQMDESLRNQAQWGVSNEQEDDGETFKRMLIETNPWLLGLTFVVTILHMIFDWLAFKNDIQYWKNRKSVQGISVRTIFLNIGCQIVILLYLLDNDTSWMILLSSGIGLCIEIWKVQKAMDVSIEWKFGGKIPWPIFKDKVSYSETHTKEFDIQAMKYLTRVLYVLIVGYSIYSLYYQTHKSWYSWILSSLVGTVYTFGFIMMTPQLIINYKLKSVSHLPWRVLIYKALNTFIDDLFAFIIHMPTMHRLSCFRDDIIFFIYLYQRWIYPVDKNRRFEEDEDGAIVEGLPDEGSKTDSSTPSTSSATTTTTQPSTTTTSEIEKKTQ